MNNLFSFVLVWCLLSGFLIQSVNADLTATLSTGEKLCKEGKFEEALKLYEAERCQVKSLQDKETLERAIADIYYSKIQDYAGAIVAYLKFIETYPKAFDLKKSYFRLGASYEQTGDYLKAAEAYQNVATKFRGEKDETDSLALDGVERCFKKNFKDNIAIVDGVPITRLEFDEELNNIPAFYRSQYETDEGKEKFLDQMIERQLLASAAEREEVWNDPGVTKKLRENRQRTLIQSLIDREVSKGKVTDEEIKKYYDEHTKDEFLVQAQARAKWILTKNEGDAKEALKEVRKKGAIFDSIAAYRSIDSATAVRGGDLGIFFKGQKTKEVEDVIFSKKMIVGKISGIVKVNHKYCIFKVEGKEKDKISLRQIVVGSEDEAKALLSEVKGGGKFDSLAKVRSIDTLTAKNGGDMGFISKKDLPLEILSAVEKLKPGEITDVVKAYPQFAIFQLVERKPQTVRPFSEVKESIRSRLLRPKQQEQYDKFLAGLKQNAKIQKFIKSSSSPDTTEKSDEKKSEKK